MNLRSGSYPHRAKVFSHNHASLVTDKLRIQEINTDRGIGDRDRYGEGGYIPTLQKVIILLQEQYSLRLT